MNSLEKNLWFLLFSVNVVKTLYEPQRNPPGWNKAVDLQPFFGNAPTNRTILSGQTAYLECRVHLLGNKTVTWMRVRDFHILTIGPVSYTRDERIKVFHDERTDDWTLQIRYSQPKDSGVYKCQVNSRPKIVRNFFLKVTTKDEFEGQLYKMASSNRKYDGYDTCITGPRVRFVESGGTLTLECIVTYVKTPPPSLLWYKGNHLLDYNSPRGGISLKVETSGDQTVSKLLLYSFRPKEDSGNYTCLPFNAPSASTTVYVERDKNEVIEVQLDNGNPASVISVNTAVLAFSFVLAITLYFS
ncbi:zwei Ig domain protein zig-8-like [Palaemon carinicauda]|uniref:zwei Ig domain protein zig-8-like n=1 Tax=Palaemon carinicauda TaxID=392227 RepID=UPI0035B58764